MYLFMYGSVIDYFHFITVRHYKHGHNKNNCYVFMLYMRDHCGGTWMYTSTFLSQYNN